MTRIQQVGALAFALVLITSMGVAAVGTSTTFDSSPDDPMGAHEADEVYVLDDGDAVLVYEESHEDDPDADAVAGEFGIETQAGLMHTLYSADFSEMDDEDDPGVTGDMTMFMTPEMIGSSGDFTFSDEDDEFDEFDASVDVEQSPDDSYADMSLSTVIEEENFVEEETVYEVDASSETTATSLSTTGSMTIESAEETEVEMDESMSVTLTQDGDTYDLSVDETRTVTDHTAPEWETEADAQEALEREYQAIAMNLGGDFDLSLEAHDFDDATNEVDLEYEVTFDGVQDQLAEMIAMELQQDPELQLDPDEAQAMADRLVSLEIEEAHVSAEMTGSDVDAEWNVELDNYDEVVLGVVEIAEAIDEVDDEMADQFDEVRDMLEAQADADLVQTNEFELAMTERPEETELDMAYSADADNWAAYVDELEDRGVDQFAADVQFDLDAETDGDELTLSYDYESSEEAMLERALEEMETVIEQDPMVDDEMAEPIEQFRNAEFELARTDMEITEESVEFEAAMSFDDMTELEGVPFETDDGLTVTSIHAETDDATTTMYLTVEDYVSEDADEDEVREHETAGDETEIHIDDWDREFPSIDEDAVESYLEEATADDDDSSLLVIAGAAVGGIAVLGGLFIAYRKLG